MSKYSIFTARVSRQHLSNFDVLFLKFLGVLIGSPGTAVLKITAGQRTISDQFKNWAGWLIVSMCLCRNAAFAQSTKTS